MSRFFSRILDFVDPPAMKTDSCRIANRLVVVGQFFVNQDCVRISLQRRLQPESSLLAILQPHQKPPYLLPGSRFLGTLLSLLDHPVQHFQSFPALRGAGQVAICLLIVSLLLQCLADRAVKFDIFRPSSGPGEQSLERLFRLT